MPIDSARSVTTCSDSPAAIRDDGCRFRSARVSSSSARSSPTPSTGSAATAAACPASARLTYSPVAMDSGTRDATGPAGRGAPTAEGATAGTSGTRPDQTRPVFPSTVTSSPSCRVRVPERVPTTAGTPSSRATIAAWQVTPPESVTSAAARRTAGIQSGLVNGATSTSPSTIRTPSAGEWRTRTRPVAVPGDAASPRSRGVACD